MKTNDGVVAFKFGIPGTTPPNQRISEVALKKARELLNGRIYTQLGMGIEDEEGIVVEYIEDEEGYIEGDFCNPPPTLRIARGAVKWAKRHNLARLWVVAAKPHLWRALRDIQRAIREEDGSCEVKVCKEIEQSTEDSWFYLASTQDHTRSLKAWRKREQIIKLLPFFIYRCIAS